MRKAIVIAIAATFAIASVTVAGRVPAPQIPDYVPEGYVDICHVPGKGHDADFLIGVDAGAICEAIPGAFILRLPEKRGPLKGHGVWVPED